MQCYVSSNPKSVVCGEGEAENVPRVKNKELYSCDNLWIQVNANNVVCLVTLIV